jgi:hypothetical protein
MERLINFFRYKNAGNSNLRSANTPQRTGHFITVRWNTGWEMVSCTTGS